MKFLYTCDIHGDINKYEAILKILKENNIKNLVIGGDLLPKKASLRAPLQRRFINGYFKNYLQNLKEKNIKFIGTLGNDDVEQIEDDFQNIISKFDNYYDINEKKADIEGISFIGLAKVLDTPFFRKDRIVVEEGKEIEEQLQNIVYINSCKDALTAKEWEEYRKTKVPKMKDTLNSLPKATNGNKLIYVFHEPPYGIGLDETKLNIKAGSRDVLNYIKENKPLFTFHGHIHESPSVSGKWFTKVGKTICIQPGQSEYSLNDLHYCIIDTDNLEYKNEHYIIPENEMTHGVFE